MKEIFTNINIKDKIKPIFIIALFIPLFFINLRDSHDWGGDFAQYISQSSCIIKGIPQSETGYVFNDRYSFLGPATYPVGFPILLSPIYYFFGNNIQAFSFFLTSIFICLLLVVFLFLRNYFSFGISLLAVLFIGYNPWMLMFKGEIMSDLPFTLFFMLALLVYIKNEWGGKLYIKSIIVGLLIGYSMLIKSIGTVLLLGILLDNLTIIIINIHKDKKSINYSRITNIMIIAISAILSYLLVSKILLPGTNDTHTHFLGLFDFTQIGNILLQNAEYYTNVFLNFFHPNNKDWSFAPLITKSFCLSLFILGLFISLFQRPNILLYIILLLLLVILSFPNACQGFRLLIPILPLILYYIIIGLQSIRLKKDINRTYLIVGLSIILLLQYKHGIERIINHRNATLNGPQREEAIEVFKYIQNYTPINSTIICNKPRVIALYTKRSSFVNHPRQSMRILENTYHELGFDYILSMEDEKNAALSEYISKHANQLQLIFENKKFSLYKKAEK